MKISKDQEKELRKAVRKIVNEAMKISALTGAPPDRDAIKMAIAMAAMELGIEGSVDDIVIAEGKDAAPIFCADGKTKVKCLYTFVPLGTRKEWFAFGVHCLKDEDNFPNGVVVYGVN